ncbi:MAG: DUF2281 domain-containing protein [Methylotenera sp.]|uniref:DUF2281 domain-containing protein n=1 Tax=Methylotenera sp. TaxID=2051956 RepID=UPI00273201F8|nr:DUF2281 domain-containing protein [Methylotenera sp.]MDP1523964.1 DUF2281 domain-containing protein [Methylotenera sp.]MDZ4212756.1 DUF2281 domain-containing protein [Methylotenera sp.]
MKTAERILEETKNMPEPLLAELLDFTLFLKQKYIPAPTSAQFLNDLRGGLENSTAFADDAVTIQKKLRDEWH